MINKFKYIALIISFYMISACSPKLASKKKSGNPGLLRIMSYNIHHCNPPSKPGLIDIDAIATVIKKQNPDVVALQEVDVHTNRSGKIDQATLLANKTDMNVYFAKAIDHDGGDYGIAILSKYPLKNKHIYKLPGDPITKAEPRVLVTVTIKIAAGKEVIFGCTHLDAQRDPVNRLMQMKEILRLSDNQQLPFVLAGDLNSRPGSAEINLLDKKFVRSCTDCAFTIPVVNPKSTLDHIAVRSAVPFDVINHEVVPERYASDHLPVVAEIILR